MRDAETVGAVGADTAETHGRIIGRCIVMIDGIQLTLATPLAGHPVVAYRFSAISICLRCEQVTGFCVLLERDYLLL